MRKTYKTSHRSSLALFFFYKQPTVHASADLTMNITFDTVTVLLITQIKDASSPCSCSRERNGIHKPPRLNPAEFKGVGVVKYDEKKKINEIEKKKIRQIKTNQHPAHSSADQP